MCVNKGMVSGHTQAIDLAPIKANTSMERLELKRPFQSIVRHFGTASLHQRLQSALLSNEPVYRTTGPCPA